MKTIKNIPHPFFNQLIKIGQLRDSILVGASLVYALGYLVWSLTAMKNNLGLIPALDFQYFLAGVVPAFLILIVLWAILSTKKYTYDLRNWFTTDINPAKSAIKRILIFICVLSILGTLFSLVRDVFGIFRKMDEIIFNIIALVFAITTPLVLIITLPNNPEDIRHLPRVVQYLINEFAFSSKYSDRFVKWFYTRLLFYLAITMIFFFAIKLYVKTIYPQLPQAFGGPQPRIACLDINSSQVSRETLLEFCWPDSSYELNKVIRTKSMQVLFNGSNSMIVRRIIVPDTIFKVFELPRHVVQDIYWISE
jgi:hypothetical protein